MLKSQTEITDQQKNYNVQFDIVQFTCNVNYIHCERTTHWHTSNDFRKYLASGMTEGTKNLSRDRKEICLIATAPKQLVQPFTFDHKFHFIPSFLVVLYLPSIFKSFSVHAESIIIIAIAIIRNMEFIGLHSRSTHFRSSRHSQASALTRRVKSTACDATSSRLLLLLLRLRSNRFRHYRTFIVMSNTLFPIQYN